MSGISWIQDASAKMALGLICPEDLPWIAANAMGEGLDSPSLRVLAALSPMEAVSEARQWFSKVLREVGAREFAKREAVDWLARTISRALLARSVTPIAAARAIWDLSLQLTAEEQLPQLDSFIYAASEWDERPDNRADFESGIVDAARHLLDLEP